MLASRAEGLLAQAEAAPLQASSAALATFGSTLVVAPHPDDETLGSGGAIALLRRRDLPVAVFVVSDGAASHPRSRCYPPPALRALREREAVEALGRLGVGADALMFLGLPDGAVPVHGEPTFNSALEQLRAALLRLEPRPGTVLLPWRRDPHCDHRATSQLTRAALASLGWQPRLLEYPIWAWKSADPSDLPRAAEVSAWRLDISEVLAAKRSAIVAYRSQTTALIDDDPTGFRLSAATLTHFERPWELYLEQAW